MAVRPGANKNNSLKQPKEEINVKYMHRPPTIAPNYGNQKRSLLPKSKVSRVLLYDNATQDHMLDIKLAHINIEKERISRIINLHQRSFCLRMSKKKHIMPGQSAGSRPKLPGYAENLETERTKTTVRPLSMVPLNSSGQLSQGVNLGGIKFPDIATDDKRHVIFKVKTKSGRTEVYRTVDNDGYLSDLIPMYPKLTDDPRFKSLQSILIPLEAGSSAEF